MIDTNKLWYVYILRCSNTYLYTGISPDVLKRVLTHRAGKGAKFTKNKYPIELVFMQKVGDMKKAMEMERGIKKYRKTRKEELISEFQSNKESIIDTEIIRCLSVNNMK